MMYTAIIIAGGQGKRLADITGGEIPKPMVPLKGKPFIYWLIKYIASKGVTNIYLSLGHLGEKIENYIKSEDFDKLEINCFIESTPLGTGGGVVNVIKQFNLQDKELFVFNGDTLYLCDFVKTSMKDMNNVQLWARQSKNKNQYGSLLFDEKRNLLDFSEKQSTSNFINAGIYFFPKGILKNFTLDPISMEYDIFPLLLKRNCQIKVNVDNSPFIDIGTPKTYKNAEIFMQKYFECDNRVN